jgi:hypothetical protein
VAKRAHEADVDLLSQHELEHLLGVSGLHAHRNTRVPDGEGLQDSRQDVGADRGSRADRELARPAALEGVHQSPAVRDCFERADRVWEERVSGLREPRSPPRPDEEPGAQVFLEPLQTGSQRRLRDEQRICGAAHAARPRNLDEGSQLRQEHI